MNTTIDYATFYHDLDQIRQQRGLTWHAIWRKLPRNVPYTFGTSIKQEEPLSMPVLIPLAQWGELDLTNYRNN